MDEKLTLKSGMDLMDKCLDSALNEQRSVAHGAIDMDDWGKAQEILAVAKRNISLIEDLRVKFSQFKDDVRAAEDIIGGGDAPAKNDEGAGKAKAGKPAQPECDGAEFVKQLEELIDKYPFAMAVCNEAAGIGESFTYDDNESAKMKKPVKLSNSLWVDTAVSADKAEQLVNAVREYCVNKG